MEKKIRILIAKPGLDGHDRGAKVVVHALKNAGFEVIYTGLHQTVEQITQVALQEDVNVIGLSSLSGAHMELFTEVMERLEQKGMKDVAVVAGGIIPEDDIAALRKAGIAAVFGSGTPTSEIVEKIKGLAKG